MSTAKSGNNITYLLVMAEKLGDEAQFFLDLILGLASPPLRPCWLNASLRSSLSDREDGKTDARQNLV